MGRLFWKFFFFFMIAQLATALGVGLTIWLRDADFSNQAELVLESPTARSLDAPSTTLERGGVSALRTWLRQWSRKPGPAVYVVEPDGRELLGRAMPRIDGTDGLSAARRIVLADGRSYFLVADEGGHEVGAGPRRLGFPVLPIAFGVLASLAVAALLAWYVSKPIRSLRQAFDAAAHGDLDVRIGGNMGRRRDELADLGHDFDRMAARLKLLMDGQRRLLHDVSHELRSPLARLQAAVGLTRQQPGNVDVWMDRIERESIRMDKLIDELLTLSRVEAGMGATREDNVDLVELMNGVVQDASFEVDPTSMRVAFDMDFGALGAVSIKGNAETLHRALENVVRNAVRHTPPGARVHVAGWRDRVRPEIHIMIGDEGPGVPVTELQSIFEPFFRGAAARETRGHGLGLAIARRVVEAHGGSISASNLTSGGLAVEIRLPG